MSAGLLYAWQSRIFSVESMIVKQPLPHSSLWYTQFTGNDAWKREKYGNHCPYLSFLDPLEARSQVQKDSSDLCPQLTSFSLSLCFGRKNPSLLDWKNFSLFLSFLLAFSFSSISLVWRKNSRCWFTFPKAVHYRGRNRKSTQECAAVWERKAGLKKLHLSLV